jgi:iron(III) transport system substrate-binding protein
MSGGKLSPKFLTVSVLVSITYLVRPGAPPVVAASLVSSLQVAAVAPSQESERQREARLVEGAKKEGKLMFWTGGTAKDWQYVFSKFRQKYSFLTTDYWRATDADLYQKITTEARAGQYNVDVSGADVEYLQQLKNAGLMKKYNWPNTAGWSPQYKDREGYWIAHHVLCLVPAYNTNLVSAAEAPKSWDDLLDPKWNKAISMDKDGGDWVLMLWSAWGKEKTVNYLKQLARNNLVFGEGAGARTQMLAAGAVKIDLRLNLHQILEYQKKNAPLDWVRTEPILSRPGPLFIAQHAPHPNAAVLFGDWFSSLEGQQAYYEASGKLVPDPKVKSHLSEALKGLKISVLPAELTVRGNEAGAIWRDIFWK